MKYLAFIIKIELVLIGAIMMYLYPDVSTPPFMSGLAIASIGIYLALQGVYGRTFSECIFNKPEPVVIEKKKSIFSR